MPASDRCDMGPFRALIQPRHPLDIVEFIAFDRGARLESALAKVMGCAAPAPGNAVHVGELAILWAGPWRWQVVIAAGLHRKTISDVKAACDDVTAVIDQSHGKFCLSLSGECARDILAAGSAVDFRRGRFVAGNCAATAWESISVLVHACAREGRDVIDIYVRRSWARCLAERLLAVGREYNTVLLPAPEAAAIDPASISRIDNSH
ncbi:MAG: sarcosine oxidase subunit gamma family protein [Betaproteobacteria bacterium]